MVVDGPRTKGRWRDAWHGWARGAHYWEDYQIVSGIPIAMRRRVVARVGSTPLPVNVLHATLTDVRVDLD